MVVTKPGYFNWSCGFCDAYGTECLTAEMAEIDHRAHLLAAHAVKGIVLRGW